MSGPSLLDAPGTTRTSDLCLRRAALYPLSYGRAASTQDTGDAGFGAPLSRDGLRLGSHRGFPYSRF